MSAAGARGPTRRRPTGGGRTRAARLGRRVATACVTLPLALAAVAVAPAPATAATEDIIAPSDPNEPKVDSGWQAGTCTKDENEEGAKCSVDTPGLFFERAAGHPPVGFTQFIIEHEEGALGPEKPVGELATVRVDLPAGLTVNPQAAPQCPLETFEEDPENCPEGSEVGQSFVTASVQGKPEPFPEVPTVYNLIPRFGEPALFGFHLAGNDIFLEADVAWEDDYHEGFTIDVPETPFAGLFEGEGLILKNRLVFDGTAGDGTFISTPTTCRGEATPSSPFTHVYSTWLLASSIEEEEAEGYDFATDAPPPLEVRIPPGTSPKECDTIPFDPSIEVDPNTGTTDSPSGAEVTVRLPEILGAEEQSTSHLRHARVTLPLGMGLNPSAAEGLAACTDAQLGKGTRRPVACPEASRVGTVEIETPPLPPGSIGGEVYVGEQLSRDPASGEQFRIFVHAHSERFGISARLVGNVAADPRTGRLTTTFADNPQVPFSSFRLELDGGPRAPLTSPPLCGPHRTTAEMTPWSAARGTIPAGEEGGPNPDPPATRSAGFTLASRPGGGPCPASLADRPFSPGFGVHISNPRAGAFSPIRFDISRPAGQQELKRAVVDLPPGLTAKLAGVPYCPEAAIAAAARNGGVAEAAASSCPPSSQVGSASVLAGSGSDPLEIEGKVFLAGPYKGAPLSLAVVTPAAAGPFDLGTVAVRVALFVDPQTASIRAVSDTIAHVVGGVPVGIRSISLAIDREGFSLNPTKCLPMAAFGALQGGAGNPHDPSSFSTVGVWAPFQVEGCEALGFQPRLFLRLFGPARRAKNPKLRAIFLTRRGDANPSRVATILPRALILDQANIARVCTRVQYEANACPRHSVYGFAVAHSPLLDEPLRGPVVLRSSDNVLPDLVAALRGQVSIDLVGRTDSVKGRIRSVFDVLPDVPVTAFGLVLRGGPRGLLVNSRNLCPRRGAARRGARRSEALAAGRRGQRRKRRRGLGAFVNIRGQNGKRARSRVRIGRPCAKRRRAGNPRPSR